MIQKYKQTAIDYKKNVAGKFMLVEGAKLRQRVEGERLCVTRKIDGHMQCVCYDNGEVVMLNSHGRQVVEHLNCLDVFAEAVRTAGISQLVVAAELYLPARDGGRPRCGDVQRALADDELKKQLSLAPFDIVELNGESWNRHYAETHGKLQSIFKKEMVAPVQMQTASSHDEVQAIYDQWVVEEGAEGLVVHSESSMIWKVKPRHTIDAVIIGYTTGTPSPQPSAAHLGQGGSRVRDLMLAVRREDGCFQMFAHASGGLSDDDRCSLADRLSTMHVESQYVLSDSRGIAYQMVRPEIVYEVSVMELVACGNDDKVRMNPLLRYIPSPLEEEAGSEAGWLMEGMTPGVSALGLTFERERTDKTPSSTDIRLSQLTDLCPFEQQEGCMAKMESSQLLDRRIYKKVSGEKVMLHKFLIWKTNKEATGRYPAYVFYHTDYSSGRKEMIKRDMAYSCEEAQIRDIMEREITANIKKGWECLKR